MMKNSYTKWTSGEKIVLVLLVLLLLLAVNVFAQDWGKVRGRVIDADTKEPIVSVKVILTGDRFNSSAVSDLEGYYAVIGVPPGYYKVVFSHSGYKTIEVSGVEVWSDLATSLDEMMDPSVGDLPACRIEWERPNIVIPEEVVQKEEVYDPEPEMVSSDELEHTIISAHMETPIEPGKNVIYCSTFQIAWNMMQDSIIKEDILLEGDPEIARMLNKQLSTADDINEDCYVAMADTLTQEFLDRINRVLEEKFGDQAPPTVTTDIDPILMQIFSYAYLYKSLKFDPEFEVLPVPVYFKCGLDTTEVKAFGVPTRGRRDEIRNHVSVIDYNHEDDFIIKLLSESAEDEIILAKIPPRGTLLEMIQSVQKRMLRSKSSSVEDDELVAIPKCDFNVHHSFVELEGRIFKNLRWKWWYISKAVQWIRFGLSERGVVLKSEARLEMVLGMIREDPNRKPRRFVFDKPFLICLRQKDGRYPYFAMWVDNGELLVGWEE